MPKKIYHVTLTQEEEKALRTVARRGKASARKITRARILLLAHGGKKDQEIINGLQVGRATVERVRKKFIEGGVELAINERPRPGGQPKLDAKAEATLIALACSDAPEGRRVWTMQLLADQLVEMGLVDRISDETVRRYLKKTIGSPGSRLNGVSRRWIMNSSPAWKIFLTCTPRRMIPAIHWSALMSIPCN